MITTHVLAWISPDAAEAEGYCVGDGNWALYTVTEFSAARSSAYLPHLNESRGAGPAVLSAWLQATLGFDPELKPETCRWAVPGHRFRTVRQRVYWVAPSRAEVTR